MRVAIAITVSLLLPALALSAPPEVMHYLGEVKLTSPTGQSMGSQVIMLEKTLDRDNSKVIEHGVVIQANGKVEESTMYLNVKADNSFILNDAAKTVEGIGQFFGPAWKWTYFKGTFKTKTGIVIEDENFLADDAVGVARKKVIAPDGKTLMYMDMSLKAITPKTYEILRAGLIKK